MASKKAIASVLNGLAANYSKALDPALPEIWFLAFGDVSDDQLNAAVGKVVASEEYFPTVAKMRNAMGLNKKALPDVAGIRERLRHMAAQNDDRMPSVERVKLVLGEAIGNAYGFIGPNRLEGFVFDGFGVGTDIATREFADLLAAEQDNGADLTLLPVAEVLRLNAAPAQLPANVQHLLRAANG